MTASPSCSDADTIFVDALPFKMGSKVRHGLYVPGAASVHAVLDRGASGELELWDLNTAGGTWVNDVRVRRSTVRHADTILLADRHYQLEVSAQGVFLHALRPWAWHDAYVQPAPPALLRSFERCLRDPRTARYVALSALAHWSVLCLAMTWPDQGSGHLARSEDSLPDVLVTLASAPPVAALMPAVAQPQAVRPRALIGDAHAQDFGTKRAGEEGAAGDLAGAEAGSPETPNARASTSERHSPSKAPAHKRDAPQRARQVGVLSMLDALSVSMNTPDVESSLALRALDRASNKGQLGLGLSGAGRGGAGQDERSIGVVLGLKRQANHELGNQGMHEDSKLKGEAQDTSIESTSFCLDPSSVKRVIDAKARQVRTCYEDSSGPRLGRRGALHLKVRARRSGHVHDVDVQHDTLQMPDVRACVMRQLSTLRFAPVDQSCRPVQATTAYIFQPKS